ncbi:MAG: hypothetical protein ACMXYE_05195 [Candidatus Woesearchaeota archaeon]
MEKAGDNSILYDSVRLGIDTIVSETKKLVESEEVQGSYKESTLKYLGKRKGVSDETIHEFTLEHNKLENCVSTIQIADGYKEGLVDTDYKGSIVIGICNGIPEFSTTMRDVLYEKLKQYKDHKPTAP